MLFRRSVKNGKNDSPINMQTAFKLSVLYKVRHVARRVYSHTNKNRVSLVTQCRVGAGASHSKATHFNHTVPILVENSLNTLLHI